MPEFPKDMKILYMDSPTFTEDLMRIIGAEPGEKVTFHGPQFERVDGVIPLKNPADLFASFHKFSKEVLQDFGMAPWGEHGLWLFPYPWYEFIPAGYLLTCITGEEEPFVAGQTDDDYRFGMLAYGIVPDFEKENL